MSDLALIADQLARTYGPDITAVGPDGNEDEFGDMLCEAWEALTGSDELTDLWEHFNDVAIASRATTYMAWLAELEAVVTIYARAHRPRPDYNPRIDWPERFSKGLPI